MKGPAGRMTERWRLTGDGASTTYLLQPDTRGRVESAAGDGNWSHDIPANGVISSTGFTITFAAAPANGATYDVDVVIRISA
jgi:hypothetical protein